MNNSHQCLQLKNRHLSPSSLLHHRPGQCAYVQWICVMPRSETDCMRSIIHIPMHGYYIYMSPLYLIHLSLLDLSKLYQLHTCRSTILQSFKGSIPRHVVWLAFNQLSNRQVVVQIHPQRQLSTYVALFFSKWHRRYYILFVKYS